MNNTLQHNLATIRKGIRKSMPGREKNIIIPIFLRVANAAFEWIDSHAGYYQDKTFNLRDSTGVGIYKEGVLMQWVHNPPPLATSSRVFTGVNTYGAEGSNSYYSEINGRELLNRAIANSAYSDFAYYSLVLYSTAPYGILVEDGNGDRGTGWWTEGLVPHVRNSFLLEVAKYQLQ